MARKGKKNAARTAKHSQSNSVSKAHEKMLKVIDQEMEAGRLGNALKYAEKLTADNPGLPTAWEKLSNIYAKSERARDAVEAYKKCISSLGGSTEATELKLSQYEIMAGWSAQAIDRLSALCTKNPKSKKNWQHLSRAYHEIGKNKEALSANDEAYALDAEDDGVLMLRCSILDQLQRSSEAKKTAVKLKEIAPDKINVSNYLGSLELREGNYIAAEKHFSDEMEVAESSIAAYNRFISRHYNPEVPIDTFKEEAVRWYERFKADKQINRASTLNQINKKIKIGLLSGGFRTHPVGQMIYPALANINHAECELIVFSTHQAEDNLTTKIKSVVEQWHSVSGLSDTELDSFIRETDIDILIDMNGGGEGSRFRMLTHEPAPLIVKWVGILINTTGLKCIDYLLSDSFETPEGVDESYTEKLIRLPNDYICYHVPDYAAAVNELPAKQNGYITFGCLNNPAKLSDPLIEEWSKVLKELPGSKLLLKNTQFEGEEFRQKTRDRFASFGIEEDRLILDGPEKHAEFLKAYHRIDIALDTWPYSGGLTTCEALMMGVPVVTCTGPTFAGRHSATHLANAGLHELVTDNWEDFHRRVKELASDIESLSTIRSALRTIVKDSPLCNGKLFADHFITAMRSIWQRHCEGKTPEALTMNKEGHAQFEDEDTPVVLASVENTSDQVVALSLDEPVIVVDNAALMPKHPRFSELLQSGNMAIMSFDPGSQYTKQAEELKALGEWHHHPHALLGDGTQQTLYVTLDPKKTGTLKPLQPEQLPERFRHDLQILSELPIDSLRLNDIQGLPSVDILLLDDVNDAMAVLENGSYYLKDALAIQVSISFQPTHEKQCNLGNFQDWAYKNGFQFYTLKNLEYYSYSIEERCDNHTEIGELASGEALFLPNRERLKRLHENDKKKLEFYLDAAYQIKGIDRLFCREKSNFLKTKKNTDVLVESVEVSEVKENDQTSLPSPAGPPIPQIEHVKGEPVVTVLCPTYNHGPYIEDALKGFVAQKTNFPFEVIVIDDASTDGAQNVISQYAKTYPDLIIPVFNEVNLKSQNKALSVDLKAMVRGKYMAHCEGDDYWVDESQLQQQYDFMESNLEYSVCYHNAFVFKDKEVVSWSKLPDRQKRDFSQEDLILNNCFLLTMTRFVRKEDYFSGPIPEKFRIKNGDNLTITRLGLAGKGKYLTSIKPAAYRLHDKSLWSSQSSLDKSLMLSSSLNWIGVFHDREGRGKVADFYYRKAKVTAGANYIKNKPGLNDLSNKLDKLGVEKPCDILEFSSLNNLHFKGSDNAVKSADGVKNTFILNVDGADLNARDRQYKIVVVSDFSGFLENPEKLAHEIIRISSSVAIVSNETKYDAVCQKVKKVFARSAKKTDILGNGSMVFYVFEKSAHV